MILYGSRPESPASSESLNPLTTWACERFGYPCSTLACGLSRSLSASVAQNAGAETSCMYASPKIHLHKIPKGYLGTLKTVEHIIDLIKHGAKDFHVRQTAIDILLQRAVTPKDYLGETKALFEWVRQTCAMPKRFSGRGPSSSAADARIARRLLRRHRHSAGGDVG